MNLERSNDEKACDLYLPDIVLMLSSLAVAQREPDKIKAVTPEVQTAEWAQAWWSKRHEEKLKEKDELKQVDLLMIGDSITHGWEGRGKKVWEKYYAKRASSEHWIQRRSHGKRPLAPAARCRRWDLAKTGRDHDRHQQHRAPPGQT